MYVQMCISCWMNVRFLDIQFLPFVLYYFLKLRSALSSCSACVWWYLVCIISFCFFFCCFFMKVYILYIFCYLRYFGTQIFISRYPLGHVHADPCSWVQVSFRTGYVRPNTSCSSVAALYRWPEEVFECLCMFDMFTTDNTYSTADHSV